MKFIKHPNKPDTFINLEQCIQIRKVTYARTGVDTEYCICFDFALAMNDVRPVTFSYVEENLRDAMFMHILRACLWLRVLR